jgi:hypothetical protein
MKIASLARFFCSAVLLTTLPPLSFGLTAAEPLNVAVASSDPMPTASQKTAACLALQNVDFSGIQDAPTQLTSAKIVEASDDAPTYCKIEGYISPQVGLEVRLPLSNWNGKLVAVGNGGWGGAVNGEACDAHLKRGYTCVTTDTGHKGRGDDGLWALSNLPAQADFGFRAVHVATLAAKSIVGRYYAKPPGKSYFMSCSMGGFQGLVEAQRFPWDFDGIIAGAPDMDEADLAMRDVWARRAFFDETGKPILDAKAIGLLHQAALDQCDMDDGVKDGLIGNPIACAFNPSRLLCKTGKTQACLSASQVEAAKRIYDGPPHSAERPVIRGALPGSEMMWSDKFPGLAFHSQGSDSLDSFFKYMVYGSSPGWTSDTYDFESDYKRLGLAALYTDTNPDLRRFKAAGGKLIAYQGGNDVIEMPGAIVDYYQTVERVMGGREPTQDFFRLFIVPGMNHCVGGTGAWAIDYLSYLEAWVEENHAPDKVIGAHVSDSYLASLPLPSSWVSLLSADSTTELRNSLAAFTLRLPLAPSVPVTFTRPMYPYPLYAKYAGGDPNQAESFRPAQR